MDIICYYILFLLLKIVSLEAFSTWEMGVGSKVIMEEMHRRAKENNFTFYENYEKGNDIYVRSNDIYVKGNGIYVKGNPKLIQQRLDNFNPQDGRTWYMRYLEYLGHFKPNGPIYLLINGESEMVDGIAASSVNELARETNGAIFVSEHRYYGKSMPLDISQPMNLRYLNSKQALADLANLIANIKSQPAFWNSKVVAVGGSYAGNLATWMREKYPNLVDCAWASSAPVLAKTAFIEYLEQVGLDFMKYGGKQCYDKIAYSFGRFHEMFKTAQGIEQFKKEQRICPQTDMRNPLNRAGFLLTMIGVFMETAQYKPEYIKMVCGKLMMEKDYTTTLRNELIKLINNTSREAEYPYPCYDYEFKYMYKGNYGPWMYQKCTEFGYFKVTGLKMQPFSNDIILDYYTQMCFRLFGQSDVDKAVANTNNVYGGLRPNVTKVVFVHGSIDPWHRLGITESLSNDVLATMIEGTTHCADLLGYWPSELPQLTAAREYAKKVIKYWLGF